MRSTMAMEGVLVAGVEVLRANVGAYSLACRVRITSRGIWTDGGRLLQEASNVGNHGREGRPFSEVSRWTRRCDYDIQRPAKSHVLCRVCVQGVGVKSVCFPGFLSASSRASYKVRTSLFTFSISHMIWGASSISRYVKMVELADLCRISKAVESAIMRLERTASLVEVERVAIDVMKRRCFAFNNKRPEVIAIAYEHDPRNAHLSEVAAARLSGSGTNGMASRLPRPSPGKYSRRIEDRLGRDC